MIAPTPSEVFGVIPIPALGGFLSCCPYALLKRDDVHEVWTAHRWWSTGQLSLAYGGEISIALRNAISGLDVGINHGEKDRFEAASKKHGK